MTERPVKRGEGGKAPSVSRGRLTSLFSGLWAYWFRVVVEYTKSHDSAWKEARAAAPEALNVVGCCSCGQRLRLSRRM